MSHDHSHGTPRTWPETAVFAPAGNGVCIDVVIAGRPTGQSERCWPNPDGGEKSDGLHFSFRPRRLLIFSGCYSVGTLGIEKERNSPLSLSPSSTSSSPYAVTPPFPPPSIDSRPSHFDCALRSAAGKLSVWRLCRLRVKQVSHVSLAINGCVCIRNRVLMVVFVWF